MRLLVLGITYAPEMIGIAVYTTGLAEAMAEHGHDVSVVTAVPSYPGWKVFDGVRKRGYRSKGNGPRVVHCPLYVPRVPSGARRILHYASFALCAAPVTLYYALRYRSDMVFVAAPALLSAPVGWLVARLTGAKCWLHVQDFEVEAAFATGLLPQQGLAGRLARRFERWILRRFDRVSSISRPMLDKLRDKGVALERIFELRNWADLTRIAPGGDPAAMRAELGIATPHVALYSGNLANKQGLEILPEIARRLAHRRDLTIAVCGNGPLEDRLRQCAEGLENIRFFPLQPKDKLNALLGMADVHLLPQIAGAADLVLPSKLTNMLASGRPVIATAEAGTALAEEVEGCGRIVPPGDAAAAAAALEHLLDTPALRQSLGRHARARAVEHLDGDRILGRFAVDVTRMTGQPAGWRTGPAQPQVRGGTSK